MLSKPLRHHERLVMIVFNAPTANRTTTVEIAEMITPTVGSKKMYGQTGTNAPHR